MSHTLRCTALYLSLLLPKIAEFQLIHTYVCTCNFKNIRLFMFFFPFYTYSYITFPKLVSAVLQCYEISGCMAPALCRQPIFLHQNSLEFSCISFLSHASLEYLFFFFIFFWVDGSSIFCRSSVCKRHTRRSGQASSHFTY